MDTLSPLDPIAGVLRRMVGPGQPAGRGACRSFGDGAPRRRVPAQLHQATGPQKPTVRPAPHGGGPAAKPQVRDRRTVNRTVWGLLARLVARFGGYSHG